MRKSIFILFLFTVCFSAFAQEQTQFLYGKVALESFAIPDVHIVNKMSKIGVISNENGQFEIQVRENDILYFSHLNLESKSITMTKEIINQSGFIVQLTEKSILLEEIAVGNQKSIFYIDKDIMPHNLPIVNAETLKLPYANTKVEKDNSVIALRSGAVLSLDGILNRISGAYQRTKKAQELEQEDVYLQKIRKHFTDDFFITDLHIKKEYINQFLNYCASKQIISHFKNNHQFKLVKLLIKESSSFPHQIENDSTLFVKK